MWSVIEVVVDPARDLKPNGLPGYLPIEIRIDGRDLIEIVRDVELPFALRDWDDRAASPSPPAAPRGARAGAFSHLYVREVARSPLGLLEEPFDLYARGKSRVLQCTCRCLGCSDMLARVELAATSVTWSEFEHISADSSSSRKWSHEQIGPFRFEREAYAAAFAPCAAYAKPAGRRA
jgi:hypothetical protein